MPEEVVDKKSKKEEPQISMDQMLALIKQMAEANKEFAAELARNIANPPPTEEEQKRRAERVAAWVSQAQIEEESKQERRKHCVPPANPANPHRRTGSQWGSFNNTSVIAWKMTAFTQRDAKGRPYETPPVPVGVCMWCQTEFKPGDEMYDEALSWGIDQAGQVVQMNVHNGLWQ